MNQKNIRYQFLLSFLHIVRESVNEVGIQEAMKTWNLPAHILSALKQANDQNITTSAKTLTDMAYGFRAFFSNKEMTWLKSALKGKEHAIGQSYYSTGAFASKAALENTRKRYHLIRKFLFCVRDLACEQGNNLAAVMCGVPFDVVKAISQCDSERLFHICEASAAMGHRVRLELTAKETDWLYMSLEGRRQEPNESNDIHRLSGLLVTIKYAAAAGGS